MKANPHFVIFAISREPDLLRLLPYLNMKLFISVFLVLICSLLLSCGKNKENETTETKTTETKIVQQPIIANSKIANKDTLSKQNLDSINSVKDSIVTQKRYSKKKLVTPKKKPASINSNKNESIRIKKEPKTTNVPSFVYLKKILKECTTGKTISQKELQNRYKIPKEGIQLVKSITKISENELDVKWKSTWLVEKMSDAKFKDGRLKVRFAKNKMYTSGDAIAIKYDKKLYTDLIMIGSSAYIPTVKGFYWQIGRD